MGDADCDTPSGGERFRNLSPRGAKGRGADSAEKRGRPPSSHRRLEKRAWINGARNGAKGGSKGRARLNAGPQNAISAGANHSAPDVQPLAESAASSV